jgi:hypothetical protein
VGSDDGGVVLRGNIRKLGRSLLAKDEASERYLHYDVALTLEPQSECGGMLMFGTSPRIDVVQIDNYDTHFSYNLDSKFKIPSYPRTTATCCN